MWVSIDPLDVVFFRDAKPFLAGESVWASGCFPPSPFALLGALRSRMLVYMSEKQDISIKEFARKKEIRDLIGGPNDLGPLTMTGPFLSHDDEVLFPWPRDVLPAGSDVVNNDLYHSDIQGAVFLKPAKSLWNTYSHGPELLPLKPSSTAGTIPDIGYLKGSSLLDYLLGDEMGVCLRTTDATVLEPRLGITLSPGRTASLGLIYTAVCHRLYNGVRLWVQLAGSNGPVEDLLPPKGFLALGGESRAGYFERVNNDDLPGSLKAISHQKEDLRHALLGRKGIKLYLLQSAIFENGWLPDGITSDNDKRKTISIQGVKLNLKAAAVGKPQLIGGWDLAHNRPRDTRRAAPPGSVYFFETEKELDENSTEILLNALHFKSLIRANGKTDDLSKYYQAAGFGLTALGLW